MNHLRALHQQVNAGTVALESDSIAMEGFVDSLKAKWEAFKKSTKPSDHEMIVHKTALIPNLKKDLLKIKQTLSNAGQADLHKAIAKMNKIAARLPVTAQSADQVIRELDKHRKTIELVGRKMQSANSPEKLKEVRENLAFLKAKKGHVNQNMDWTKEQMLVFIDVLARYYDTAGAVGKIYIDSYKKMKFSEPTTAMESFAEVEDVTSIALESLTSALGGLVLLLGGLFLYVISMITMGMGIVMLFTGQFIPALATIAAGWIGQEVANNMLHKSDRMIYGDVYAQHGH